MEACLSAHFVARTLRKLGHEPRIIPAKYSKPFVKGQKNDYNDAEAIAEAALRPNLRTVREKTQEELDLQAYHRIRARLVSRRTATINQIRAFLIEQGIAVRSGAHALRASLFVILKNRADEISPRMTDLIVGLYEDWLWLDERIEAITSEIEKIAAEEASCQQLMSVPGVGPIISTAMVAAVGDGEAFERGRDFGAWLGLVPRQYSKGGKPFLGRISKQGNRYLRMLFIQAANVILNFADDLYVAADDTTVGRYLSVFKQIFVSTNHGAHYEMMMGPEEVAPVTEEGPAAAAAELVTEVVAIQSGMEATIATAEMPDAHP